MKMKKSFENLLLNMLYIANMATKNSSMYVNPNLIPMKS